MKKKPDHPPRDDVKIQISEALTRLSEGLAGNVRIQLSKELAKTVWIHCAKNRFTWTLESVEREIYKTLTKELNNRL